MTARILAVDDIATNLRLLEAKLQAEYYEVLLASSGQEALQVAFTQLPDVILLDVMMPGMDGYEVCRALKADIRTQHIPVVMVTALTDSTERVRGLEAGADDFLSKPVDNATLFARLRALLRVKQVQDAWRLRSDTARELGIDNPAPPAISVQGARALILNSDAEEARAVREALLADDMIVYTVTSVDEAFQRLSKGDVDLALLALPVDPGEVLRLASRLRAQNATRDLPLILLADSHQKNEVLRGFDLGANDHCFRPMDPNELRARARNQVRRKRYQERLRADLDRSLEMAVTDQLTGLRNRRYVRRHLDSLLRTEAAAVLILDIDKFKAINDTYGHNVGDAALREVAERLREQLRAVDVVARYGGEEFLAVLVGAQAQAAMLVAERLREAVAILPVQSEGHVVPITISIGVAVGEPGMPADRLIGAADSALYRAKRDGRNRAYLAGEEDATAAS
ncbi:PleD family two-component system response regulator [Roseococcus suduntuyensis]|uniref:diguanylate cyclase n=1 Tax=Roseococcus suduntuyensis TaxID=455361 RepID=A0A840AHV7_9PROT|nr:PleD family two-component system response regulator [Roseococcus suduntuyensis]MBB3900136.1 two-component system cell cycle response regulator [Roseococcus suduntuyensis]